MPSTWSKRTRIDETVSYDSSFIYDSEIPYDSSYFGSQWTERTPINIPLRQENNDYILDDNEYPIMVEFTDWSKRTRIDTLVGYDSAFAYDSNVAYDSSYFGSQWTQRPNI